MDTRNSVAILHPSKHILCAWLAFVVALTGLAADRSDAKAFEGTWTPVKAELGGQPMADAVLKTITLKLHDGNYEVSVTGQQDKGTYTIDASTQPKGMTITGRDGPNKGKTFPAIYALEGQTLRICYHLSGKQRPAEFKTNVGTLLYLVTYTRRKE